MSHGVRPMRTPVVSSNERESFRARLVKNVLAYSTLYLAGQSVLALMTPLLTPLFVWASALMTIILIIELGLIVLWKKLFATFWVAPSMLVVLLLVEGPFFESVQHGPIEFSAKNIAVLVGLVVFGCGVLLCAGLSLLSRVRRELLQ